jgi:hypothetical protein
MRKSLVKTMAILMGLLVVVMGGMVQAQDSAPQIAYYLAADANGIQQIYQLSLDGQFPTRQVSHAEKDVMTFEPAYDGLGLVYISDGKLWLQSIHVDEADILSGLRATQFFSTPVWSEDGQYIAFADNGLWLMDMSKREKRQLLQNVELNTDASNIADLRIYQPSRFVNDANGKPAQLIVSVSLWEGGTVGVYDLASDTLQTLEGQVHTSLLPLSDGRVLVYGNNGLGGSSALDIADSIDNINAFHELANFTPADDMVVFVEQAVEIQPGMVRVFGTALQIPQSQTDAFHIDVDVNSGTAGELHIITFATDTTSNVVPGQLSPMGDFIPAHFNTLWTDTGSIYGTLKLFDLQSGASIDVQLPETVGLFRWQQ